MEEARIRAREDRRDSDRNALFKNESHSRLAVHVAARDIGRPSVLSKVSLEVLPTREPAPKARHPGIPADSSEPNVMTQCPIDEEPWPATAHVLGIMANHRGERSNRERLGDAMYYYHGDRVRKESKSNKDMEPPMTARQRLQSRLPRTKTHTTESDNPDRRSHFAREHPMSHRQSRNHVACVPVANRTMSQQSSTCEDSVFFWIMVQPESWIIFPA